jgi:hypothetical protein
MEGSSSTTEAVTSVHSLKNINAELDAVRNQLGTVFITVGVNILCGFHFLINCLHSQPLSQILAPPS